MEKLKFHNISSKSKKNIKTQKLKLIFSELQILTCVDLLDMRRIDVRDCYSVHVQTYFVCWN